MRRSGNASTGPQVTLHTLCLGRDGDETAANHRAYAVRAGYRHYFHHCAGGGEGDRSRLLRKYSGMLRLLHAADKDEILAFVEDSVAFSTPLSIADILGPAAYWLCQDGHWRDRGNGGLIIVRNGPEGRSVVEGLLERCQAIAPDRSSFTRWEHHELVGLQTHEHDALIAGCYPNLLFPSFGHALPGVRAFAVALNPHVLPHAQDHHANMAAIRHLTECLEQGKQPFTFDPKSVETSWLAILKGRSSPVGIFLNVEPDQQDVAALVESNLCRYARKHGYALSVRREPVPHTGNRLASMLRHLGEGSMQHAFALCLTADVLIHDLDRPIQTLFGDASLLLARSAWGSGPDDGIIGLRTDDTGKALVVAAMKECLDAGAGFKALLQQTMNSEAGRYEEVQSWAPHTAFRDRANYLIRYRGLPANVRQLLMREDAASLLLKLAVPREPAPNRTALSFFRHPRLNRIVSAAIAIAILFTVIQQMR